MTVQGAEDYFFPSWGPRHMYSIITVTVAYHTNE